MGGGARAVEAWGGYMHQLGADGGAGGGGAGAAFGYML